MSDAQTCAREGCTELFTPIRSNQLYHSPQCAQKAANDRRRAPVDGVTEEERILTRRVMQLEAAATRAKRETAEAKKVADELREDLERAHTELALFDTELEQPDWLLPEGGGKERHGTLVAVFSDQHYGEVVDPAEMAHYNAYNMEIARQRTQRFFERTILVARDYLAGVEYDGIVMPMLGDTVTGDIHDELRETNDMSVYDTVIEIVPWICAGVDMFLEEFGRVHIPAVPGNHPRNSKKPRYKKRSANNADTLVAKMIADRYRDVPEVTFDIAKGISVDFKIYDTAFRCEHGDEARGGSGIQGALLPITLRTHRVRKQAQAEGRPFDILLMGHWHQLMSNPAKGFIVNGTLKGYDEFARGKGFEPEPPQQALMVVTPEHGVSVQTPLFVSKRGDEGW